MGAARETVGECVLWRPQYGAFGLVALELDADCRFDRAAEPGRPKWITYGSSITQCRAAKSRLALGPRS
jgi:hypothetical protein